MVFSAHAEVVPPIVYIVCNLKGILRARGGSSVKEFRKSLYGEYSPRMRR